MFRANHGCPAVPRHPVNDAAFHAQAILGHCLNIKSLSAVANEDLDRFSSTSA
jgi:hypothetical protein